jgi:hypothetical protein
MEQVTSLKRLCELAQEKKSVSMQYGWPHFTCKPAAFIICMQAALVQRMIDSGMYVYEREDKK